MTLAQRLRQAIGNDRIEDVAKRAKLARSSVQHVLAGDQKAAPRLDTVEALARATGRSPAWLAFGEDDGDE